MAKRVARRAPAKRTTGGRKTAARKRPAAIAARTSTRAPARKGGATANKNVDVVRKVEEAWASGKLNELDKHFSPDFRPETTPPGLPPTLGTAKMAHQMTMQAFPDRKAEIVDIFGEGDKVCVRCRITGTNMGGLPFYGIAANNKSVDFQWIGFYTLKNGKIAGHSAINDGVTLFVQLGAMQPPGPPPG